MRALGLEPSLVPVKSRVPYLSGVARDEWAGEESNPLCRMTAGLQPAAPHGATDPFGDRCGDRSLDDASAVVNVLVSRLVVGRVGAGSEGVEPPAGGFGDRGATVTRAQRV